MGTPGPLRRRERTGHRPITIIVPYGAGGDTDFNARAYLDGLSDELGASLVVSNVTGSGGSIASRQVKDSDPDGYTVLFFHTAMNVNEAIGTADFGLDDFKLACVMGKGPGEIIVARKDAGYTNLEELKAYTQEHPGEVKMGIETGTMVHINGKQMQDAGSMCPLWMLEALLTVWRRWQAAISTSSSMPTVR